MHQGFGVCQHHSVGCPGANPHRWVPPSLPAWMRHIPAPQPQLSPPGAPSSPAQGSQFVPEPSPTQDRQNALSPPPLPPAQNLLMKFPAGVVNNPKKSPPPCP